jgi:hypothetical protein
MASIIDLCSKEWRQSQTDASPPPPPSQGPHHALPPMGSDPAPAAVWGLHGQARRAPKPSSCNSPGILKVKSPLEVFPGGQLSTVERQGSHSTPDAFQVPPPVRLKAAEPLSRADALVSVSGQTLKTCRLLVGSNIPNHDYAEPQHRPACWRPCTCRCLAVSGFRTPSKRCSGRYRSRD